MEHYDAALSLVARKKGYPLEYLPENERPDMVQQGLVCSVCDGILRDAVQVTCGERFCQECYQDLCKRKDSICPCEWDGPNNETQHLVPKECQPDNLCRHRVKRITARCVNIVLGCSWMGKLVDSEEHLDVCPFRNAMRCHCDKIFQDPTEHQQHLNNGCPQSSGMQAVPRVCSSCQHPEVASSDHIERVCSNLQQLKIQMALLSSGKTGQQYQRLSKPVASNDTTDGTRADGTSSQNQYEALLNKYKSNTSLITVLLGEVGACSQKMQRSTPNPEDVEELRQRISNLETLLNDVQGSLESIERRMSNVQVLNTNSRLTWCIENINQKIEDARSGVTPMLCSPPFFSSDAGYKMCARLYLNGVGIGKGSHVSLSFVLMEGPYDPILPSPFTTRVTMQMLDQSGQDNHVQERFKPDPAFLVTGCPLFMSLTELERRKGVFIKEDTMFIQIIVE